MCTIPARGTSGVFATLLMGRMWPRRGGFSLLVCHFLPVRRLGCPSGPSPDAEVAGNIAVLLLDRLRIVVMFRCCLGMPRLGACRPGIMFLTLNLMLPSLPSPRCLLMRLSPLSRSLPNVSGPPPVLQLIAPLALGYQAVALRVSSGTFTARPSPHVLTLRAL